MGTRVFLVFAAFAIMMSYMVYRCMQTPVDLVTKEYYKDELSYQEVIDAKKHAAALADTVRFQQNDNGILISLPGEMRLQHVTGSLQFYCPNNVSKDRQFLLQTDSAAIQHIDAGLVSPGLYTLRVKWQSDGVQYMDERNLTVL